MNRHVDRWLEAYVDGELGDARRRQVEAHLRQCARCRTMLGELRSLSTWLRRVPAPRPALSTEQFAVAVVSQLPGRPSLLRGVVNAPFTWWWSVPLILLAILAFGQGALTATRGVLWLLFGVWRWSGISASLPFALPLPWSLEGLRELEYGLWLGVGLSACSWMMAWWAMRERLRVYALRNT